MAAHLGFPAPDRPLFNALADSDPLAQIAKAAALGFDGVLDPFAMMRTAAEQTAIGAAARALNLEVGGFLYAPLDRIRRSPAWADPALPIEMLEADIAGAVAAAGRLGSRDVVILAVRADGPPLHIQHKTMSERLGRMASRAAAAGLRLHVEPVSSERLPDMLLHRLDDAARVVVDAGHPALKLAFDTGHVHANGEHVVASLDRYWPQIGAIQLADAPGRVEVGAGAIDFEGVFALLRARGFRGLCELEHGWSDGAAATQQAYPARLRALAATALKGTIDDD